MGRFKTLKSTLRHKDNLKKKVIRVVTM